MEATLISGGIMLFLVAFTIGGNIGVNADSHAEIDEVVGTTVAEIDAAGSPAAPFVTAVIKYGSAPIAHVIHSSFVPLAVWRFIGVSLALVALLLPAVSVTRILNQVRTHG